MIAAQSRSTSSGESKQSKVRDLAHAFSRRHAATGCCTGASIKSISLDPREGGVTKMSGGICTSPQFLASSQLLTALLPAAITLPAGYLGSSLTGALLIFCGFSVVASKIASFVLGFGFLLTLWWGRRDWL